MSKIKVAHEAPISFFKEVEEVTDYSYCLVHLYDSLPKYKDLFKESKKEKREVILDNSIFELGVAYAGEKYVQAIEDLEPDFYIIPDVLEDKTKTLLSYKDFIKTYNDIPGKRIGVVQGKNYKDIIDCYQRIRDMGVDKISISFDYSYYELCFPKINKYEAWSRGRQRLIDTMLDDNIIDKTLPLHLLGCSLPQEFSHYKGDDYNFIDSLDTSNPVVHGIFGIKYEEHGLDSKESMKLCDLIDTELNEVQKELVLYNIKKFRELCV